MCFIGLVEGQQFEVASRGFGDGWLRCGGRGVGTGMRMRVIGDVASGGGLLLSFGRGGGTGGELGADGGYIYLSGIRTGWLCFDLLSTFFLTGTFFLPGRGSEIFHLSAYTPQQGIYVSESKGKNILFQRARMPVFPAVALSQDFFVHIQNAIYLLLLVSILILVIILLFRIRPIPQSTIPPTRSIPDKYFETPSLPSNHNNPPPYLPPIQYPAPFPLPRPHQLIPVGPDTLPPDPTLRRHSFPPTPSPPEKDRSVISKSRTIKTPTWKRSDRVVKKNGWRRHTLSFEGLQNAGGYTASANEHDQSYEYASV